MGYENFKLSAYEYNISPHCIAQEPVAPRDQSRLLVVDRKRGVSQEGVFKDIVSFLKKGDVLVLNNTSVIRARLLGTNTKGARLDILLLKKREIGVWEVLVKPGRRARINDTIIFEGNDFVAKILDKTPQGGRILQFDPPDIEHFLPRSGKVPLPPYIKREIHDSQKYQTVYAKKRGAVAAPTAGLHFTKTLLKRIEQKGVEIVYVTLHCGLGTFRPVKTEDIRNHQMDTEWAKISSSVAQLLTKAKLKKRRIIAVGTTSVRVLESAAVIDREGIYRLRPFCRETNLYILPGYTFKIVDALITNFHTPCSTNLILASSFCEYKLLMESYAYAIKSGFRFYSFGDAMFIM